MADTILNSFSAEGILAKAASLATEPLILAWGFQKPIENLHETLSQIQDIVGDAAAAEPQDLAAWGKNLKDVANDADDVLDVVNYEVLRHKQEIQDHIKKKVLNFFSLSNPLAFRLKTTCKIKKINTSLVDLKSQASLIGLVSNKDVDATSQRVRLFRQTHPFIGEKIVVGRDEALSNIVTTVTNSDISRESLSVMAIVGMPGLGKTTVAKAVFNDNREIDKHFDKKIWVWVSNTFDIDLILSQILKCLDCNMVEIQSQEAVLKRLQEQLKEKRCLLILDDVWNEDSEKWNDLMRCLSGPNCTRGSTIIVTTRSAKVAEITATLPHCKLGFLSEDECWSILKDVAFQDPCAPIDPRLVKIGKEMAKKSAGVPFVAKVLGGMLFSRRSTNEWLSILESRIWDLLKGDDELMSFVKLSYDNLKSPLLKQCFSYCSMFEKEFEIERDNLIQLWMAQGLLHPSSEDSGDQEMEDIGSKYFNILLESSLFQDLTKDDFGSVAKCKIHVLVHEFAELISKSESFTWNSKEIADTQSLRHVAHTSAVEGIPEGSVRRLRSLFSTVKVPSDMLPRFRALHVLNLYKADIQELPSSIGKLKQLRYLNVSRTEIKALPKSIGKLHNLQTLRMEYCRSLKVFPKEVEDLINLRHIYFGPVPEKRQVNFGWYRESHVGVGQLTNLQTMSYFIVGPDQMAHGIEELGGLNQLKGELTIYDLEHVRDGDEAKKANLVGKKNIRKLTLMWGEETRLSNTNEEDNVLEGLQPHPNLEILEIHNFMGAKFSSWKQLNNLNKIRLLQCDVCEEVTMLGLLPNLMHLEFDTMINLKRLGAEFYGHNADVSVVDTRSTGETKAFFPALRTLRICAAPNLTDWTEAPVMPTEEIMVFPCLEELDLVECPHLKNVPNHFPSLRQLEISMCHELSSLPSLLEKCSSLQNLEVRSCDSITSISVSGLKSIRKLVISSTDLHSGPELYTPVSLEELFIKCASLKTLDISSCDGLISISVHGLTSLEELTIKSCISLESCPNVQGCTSLRKLTISDCDRLSTTTVESWLESCSFLRVLDVQYCQYLRHFSGDDLDTVFSHLEELTIHGCPKLICISDDSLTSVRKLVIASCGTELFITSSSTLEELSFKCCTSLRSLCIEDCQNLKHLSGDGLDTLSLLEELTIRNCPILTSIPITQGIECLRELVVEGCDELSSLPVGLEHCCLLEKVIISGCPNFMSIPFAQGTGSCLRELVVDGCDKLSSLPTALECCNSLEKLRVSSCPNLTSIPITQGIACLRELVIEGCDELSSLPTGLDYCKSLEKLRISGCSPSLLEFVHDSDELSSLPGILESLPELIIGNFTLPSDISTGRLSSLRKLVIESCGVNLSIKSRTIEELSLQVCTYLFELHIEDCQNLRYLSGDWLQTSVSLGLLQIRECPNLEAFPSLDNFGVLSELNIFDCDGLTSLPSGLLSRTSLTDLRIWSCHNLISLADQDVSGLQSLSILVIKDCGKLQYLPTGLDTLTRLEYMSIGPFWEELDSFPDFEFPSSQMETLRISGWPKLKSLPQQIENLTCLKELSILDFDGVEVLPEWLCNLTSLTELHIERCKNLMYLPTVETMRGLKLERLYISGSPRLQETCASESGSEWPKISHIPEIYIWTSPELNTTFVSSGKTFGNS